MQSTPYTLPVFLVGLLAVGMCAYLWRRHARAQAGPELAWAAAALAILNFAYAGELASASLEAKVAWFSVRWIGLAFMPLSSPAIALRWAGYDRLRARVLTPALLSAGLIAVIGITDPFHHLFTTPPTLAQRDGFTLRAAEAAPGFWLYIVWAYTCLVVSVVVFARALWASRLQRLQGGFLLVSTIVPWGVNIAYLAGLGPDPLFDFSSFGYATAFVAWAIALRWGRLFDLVPVARDRVFESLVEPVLVIDAAGRVLDRNGAALALFGDSLREGVPLAKLLGAETAARLTERGRTLEIDLRGRAFELSSAEVHVASGARAVTITFRDVSEARRVEAAREEALRMAEANSRARAEFVARMSHEVRSPLHGVVGAADLLLEAPLDERARRYAEAISTSARALMAVVDEILDFSRLESDRVEVQREDVDVSRLLSEVATMMVGAAEKKGVHLELDAPPQVVVTADAVRLRQVLVNLAGNAVKFTHRGRIVLRARRREREVRIEVEDSGVGIPAHAHERVFEAFQQVNGAPQDGVQGTGLGLSIVKHLVQLMGGRIELESEVGRGSVFSIVLPASASKAEPASEPRRAPSTARHGRALLVDDHPVSRMVTEDLLAREGLEVHVVGGGAAALLALEERGPFDLLVTDIRMPDMDGYELARRVRAGPWRALPIVAVSADVLAGARERARAAGMDEWLGKPLDPRQLSEVLGRAWRARRARSERRAICARSSPTIRPRWRASSRPSRRAPPKTSTRSPRRVGADASRRRGSWRTRSRAPRAWSARPDWPPPASRWRARARTSTSARSSCCGGPSPRTLRR